MRSKWLLIPLLFVLSITAGCRKTRTPARVVQPPPTGGNGGGGGTDTVVTEPPPAPKVHSQRAVNLQVGNNIGGFYEALPPGYEDSDKGFPLLIFLHGGGELGNGTTDLPMVLKHALPKLIDKKKFPASFTVKGESFSFIVISPQFKAWPKPADVDALMKYARENYKVDPHRIYLAGLSMGGGATWEYAVDHGSELAAIVPICGASWTEPAPAHRLADTNVPIWAFHNKDDDAVPVRSTTRYVDFIKEQNPDITLRLTLWETGGHDAWTKATDPEYKEDDENIYEWMLQYVR